MSGVGPVCWPGPATLSAFLCHQISGPARSPRNWMMQPQGLEVEHQCFTITIWWCKYANCRAMVNWALYVYLSPYLSCDVANIGREFCKMINGTVFSWEMYFLCKLNKTYFVLLPCLIPDQSFQCLLLTSVWTFRMVESLLVIAGEYHAKEHISYQTMVYVLQK